MITRDVSHWFIRPRTQESSPVLGLKYQNGQMKPNICSVFSKVFLQWNEKLSQDGVFTAGKTVAALKMVFPGTALMSPAVRGRSGVWCKRMAPGGLLLAEDGWSKLGQPQEHTLTDVCPDAHLSAAVEVWVSGHTCMYRRPWPLGMDRSVGCIERAHIMLVNPYLQWGEIQASVSAEVE